MLVYAKETGLI